MKECNEDIQGWRKLNELVGVARKKTETVAQQSRRLTEKARGATQELWEHEELRGLVSKTDHVLNRYGVKKAAESAADTAADAFDTVSGKKLLQQVEVLVEKQGLYNDVLAARLAEALDRIEALEKELALRMNGS